MSDLTSYFRTLRRRWRVIVAGLLLGVGLAIAAILAATPQYTSSTRVFVSLRQTSSDPLAAYQGGLFSQDRVRSYLELVRSPVVTKQVVERLRLPASPDELAGSITASAPASTVIIDISVRDPSAQRARDVAAATAEAFGTAVTSVETPAGGRTALVKVTVIQPATLPVAPSSPRIPLTLAVGLLAGAALGVGAAVARELLDNSVTTTEDLARATDGVVLGEIAFDRTAGTTPLIGSGPDAVRSPRGEQFRALRTNLQFIDVDRPPGAVVVTSAVAGEGKSTTACNLAITLALAGHNVVLLEGDLRRPRVADYMGVEGAVGLTDVLAGRVGLDTVIQRWGAGSLWVLPHGTRPPNPSELLASTQMAHLLGELRARADVVVVDAPPLLPVTDGAVLARACDGAILVVRHGRTTTDQVKRATAVLAGANARLVGAVLNMVPRTRADGYYGDYYEEADGRLLAAPGPPRPPAGPAEDPRPRESLSR